MRCGPLQSFERDFRVLDGIDLLAFDAKRFANGMTLGENFAHAAPAQILAGGHREISRRRAHQHGAARGLKSKQAVFEAAHDLVEIFAQSAENFADVA